MNYFFCFQILYKKIFLYTEENGKNVLKIEK